MTLSIKYHHESILKLFFLSFISISVGVCSSFYFIKRFKFAKQYSRLKRLREARILQKKENLKKFQAYLNELEVTGTDDDIIHKSFSSLMELLKNDHLSRDKVLHAFQKKAFEVNSKLNCVVDFIEIDKFQINFNGPLSGLPISVKDNFFVKDYYSSIGCSHLLDNVASKNAVLVDVIRNLGGVPFAKTTVPQTMMSILSSNPIDGITLNPRDLSKSPGGSSSGEGALIGGDGSIVGLGTDIGGSVRIPASFCGIIGFKPTSGRLSKKGIISLSNVNIVRGVVGILGRDVDAVTFLFEQIVNSPLHRKLDPTVMPLDFNYNFYQSKEKLTIGYFSFDHSYHCVPALTRSVNETVINLEKKGHKLVRWNPPVSGEQWLTMYLHAIAADGAKDIRNICRYDEQDNSVKNLLRLCEMNIFQYYYMRFDAFLRGNKELSLWLKASRGISSGSKVSELIKSISNLRNMIIDDWNKQNIDVVVCPSMGFVAIPVKPEGSMTGMLSYQNLWNLVDFPAGTVPISKVTQSDIDQMKREYPKKLSNWHQATFKAQLESLNLPISIQCVSRPWKDETLLRIMKEIQS